MSRRGGSPFKEIERFFEHMGRQVEETPLPTGMVGEAAVDVADRGDAYEVAVDLPGYEKDDVQVTLTDDTLRVSAVRDAETETEGVDYVRRERRKESVDRSVTLPESVDEDAVEATLANGVLTVTLPKQTPDEGARTIDIE